MRHDGPVIPHGNHQQERQNASQQAAAEELTSDLSAALNGMFPFGGGGKRTFYGKDGKTVTGHVEVTDFENHKLNEMIDLVEGTSPGHLTRAGKALYDARDAIGDAAEELRRHIHAVDWHGVSGSTFRKWGDGLVKSTHELSRYAGHAGTQLTVAGSGLSSVRGSMPPRDTRVHQKTVEEIPKHKRVKGNPEYDEAVKVEGHRQEAINQMNRLSSHYTVATQALLSEEPPTFKPLNGVGVPKPSRDWIEDQGGGGTESGALGRQGAVPNTSTRAHAEGREIGRIDPEAHGKIDELPNRHIGTEIDSASPPLTQAPPTVTDSATPPISPSQGQADPVNQFPLGPGPLSGGGNRMPPKAFGKTPGPLGREGIAGNKNVNPTARGTANTQMGRGPTGQERALGRGGTTARTPMGRAVTGGTPRPAGQARNSQGGAVRKGGVIGGRPATGQTKSTSGMPRGTVIGGQQQNAGRATGAGGKLSQRGVIGAQKPENGKTSPTKRVPGAPEGVVGVPKERTAGPKGERAGFTQGGSGLVRGGGEQSHPSHGHHPDREAERARHQDSSDTQHQPPHPASVNDQAFERGHTEG